MVRGLLQAQQAPFDASEFRMYPQDAAKATRAHNEPAKLLWTVPRKIIEHDIDVAQKVADEVGRMGFMLSAEALMDGKGIPNLDSACWDEDAGPPSQLPALWIGARRHTLCSCSCWRTL